MDNSVTLLKGILTTLLRIEKKIGTSTGGPTTAAGSTTSSTESTKDTGYAFSGIFGKGDIKGTLNDIAKGLDGMGKTIKELSIGLSKFKDSGGAKALTDFIERLMKAASSGIGISFKSVSQALETLAASITPLAWGVMKFGLMQKIGLVHATAVGLSELLGVLAGVAVAAPMINLVSPVLKGLGMALEGLASVLKSIGIVMLSFATSILILVGAVKLAQMLFNTSTAWEAIGMVFTIIGMFALTFSMLSVLSPAIILGSDAMAAMGLGLTLIGVGLISFLAATLVMTKIGDWKAIFNTIAVVGLLAVAFSLLGLLSELIISGADAAKGMGVALIILSVGVLAFGAVSVLLDLMGLSMDSIWNSVKMVALLGLTFAGLGVFSPFIIAGSLAAIGMSISLVILSLGLLAFVYLSDEINKKLGKDGITGMLKIAGLITGISLVFSALGLLITPLTIGFIAVSLLTLGLVVLSAGIKTIMDLSSRLDMNQVKETISDLISSTMIGVTKGISKGLLGEDGDSKGFWGKVGSIAKNTAILLFGIGLVMHTAMAVSMLGLALRAFTQAGTITTITGYDKDGKPIYGPSVDVSNAAANIATAIRTFFTTLKESIITLPSLKDIDLITAILTGYRSGPFNDRPSLMGTIIDFGKMLSQWAEIGLSGGVPVERDKNGKITKTASFANIAKAIAGSIKDFFTELSNVVINNAETLMEKATVIAEILGGVKRKIRADKPGLIDPLFKFAEIITTFANGYVDIPDPKDPKKTIKQKIDYKQTAIDIAASITGFASTLATGLETIDAKKLKKGTEKITDSFELLNTQFDKMIRNKTGIEKAAETIGKFAVKVGELGTSLNNLDIVKLEGISNLESSLKIEMSEGEGGWYPGKMIVEMVKTVAGSSTTSTVGAASTPIIVQQPVSAGTTTTSSVTAVQNSPDWNIIAQAIGQHVADALRSGQFKFEFSGSGPNGVFYMQPNV